MRKSNRIVLAAIASLMTLVWIGLAVTVPVFAWGGKPHSEIVDAALTTIPASDRIVDLLGSETRHLRNDVQMGDWVNSLIVLNENWHVTTEDFPQIHEEYFGNDYLIFPGAPRTFSHIMPDVQGTYAPFFSRALQALRTEDQVNAARWMGSLLHFITDSGSPPHTVGLTGPNHTKMENWLDASQLDLRGYQPQLLGESEEQAITGLHKRMGGLIARNAAIARKMVPLAQADAREDVEPMAMDCAAETARVSADVIHTLMVLAQRNPRESSSSLVATITAPALAAHPLLPAKLVLLGTGYSTLSSAMYLRKDEYAGSFILKDLPPGTYRAAVERPGAETIFTAPFTLTSGGRAEMHWKMQPSGPANNLVQNSDFRLRWVSSAAPDHWHFDAKENAWLSDNIPVAPDLRYRISITLQEKATRTVTLEWMAQHWKQTDSPAAAVDEVPRTIQAPKSAVYARFVLAGDAPPSRDLLHVVLVPISEDAAPRNAD